MAAKQRSGQHGQQLKVQVHRDDQSLHPGRLHGASLATAMQRPCRPLHMTVRIVAIKLLETEGDTHTHTHTCFLGGAEWTGLLFFCWARNGDKTLDLSPLPLPLMRSAGWTRCELKSGGQARAA